MITMVLATIVAFLFVHFYHRLSAWQAEKLTITNEVLENKQKELDKQLNLIQIQNEIIKNDKNYLEIRNTKLEKYTEAIIEMSSMEELHAGDFAYTVEFLMKSINEILEVDIVNIWKYEASEDTLVLIRQYPNQLKNSGVKNTTLERHKYPNYFDHMLSGMIINADDACENPVTMEFTGDYLKPKGISSLLDCPYYLDGEFAGVICCESYKPRKWDTEDIIFIKAMSSIAGISLAALHKMTHIKTLEIDNIEMRLQSVELIKKVQENDERLYSLSKQVADYANINAHKLRGPVCRLLGLLELLQRSESPEEVLKLRDFLSKSIKELNVVTEDFGNNLNGIDKKMNETD